MKTAGRENPIHGGTVPGKPSTWRGRSEQIVLDQVGCEARKTPAEGGVFFLDFYLHRTTRLTWNWDMPNNVGLSHLFATGLTLIARCASRLLPDKEIVAVGKRADLDAPSLHSAADG